MKGDNFMSSFDEALSEFGKALGKLKRAYGEEFGTNGNYIEIHIDESNNVTIVPTLNTGHYINDVVREWIDTDE